MVAELKRQVWCDVCAYEGNREPAEVEQVIALGDAAPLQVDLCEAHRAGLLAELEGLLGKVGRTPDALVAAKPRRGRPPNPTGTHATDPKPCPVCGRVLAANNVARHLRQIHGAQPATAANGETFPCPECGQVFNNAAGRGIHRRTSHGVVGTSKAAESYRKAQAERERAGDGT